MKTLLTTLAAALAAGAAFAAPSSDIRVSTDPAKIAAVEQHAKQLQARDQAAAKSGAAKTSGTAAHKHPHHHAKTPKS